jgi:biopolymer transport protein ExbD
MAIIVRDNEEESIVAEINITPLTDIFLVLLIIFMISSSAIFEGGLQVKLPSSKSTQAGIGKGTKPTLVTVTSTGKIAVNDTIVGEKDELKQVLTKALRESSEKAVVIRGDESIVLGKAVEIMDAARSAGAEKIALAAQTSK